MPTIPDDELQAAWEAWHRAWNEPSARTARETLRLAMESAAQVRAARPVTDEDVEVAARAIRDALADYWRPCDSFGLARAALTAVCGAPPASPTDKDQQIAWLTEALNRARDYLAPVADQHPVRAALAVLDAVYAPAPTEEVSR